MSCKWHTWKLVTLLTQKGPASQENALAVLAGPWPLQAPQRTGFPAANLEMLFCFLRKKLQLTLCRVLSLNCYDNMSSVSVLLFLTRGYLPAHKQASCVAHSRHRGIEVLHSTIMCPKHLVGATVPQVRALRNCVSWHVYLDCSLQNGFSR